MSEERIKEALDKIRLITHVGDDTQIYKAHMFDCPNCENILIQNWVDKTLIHCYDEDGCNKSYWLKEVRKSEN